VGWSALAVVSSLSGIGRSRGPPVSGMADFHGAAAVVTVRRLGGIRGAGLANPRCGGSLVRGKERRVTDGGQAEDLPKGRGLVSYS
jgi:hypothetical protein